MQKLLIIFCLIFIIACGAKIGTKYVLFPNGKTFGKINEPFNSSEMLLSKWNENAACLQLPADVEYPSFMVLKNSNKVLCMGKEANYCVSDEGIISFPEYVNMDFTDIKRAYSEYYEKTSQVDLDNALVNQCAGK